MQLVDFDGLFDEKLTEYMETNRGKYTEKQWENVIPKLYKSFGDTYVAKVKCTPKEYYAKMDSTLLVETFCEHLKQGVPVPDFLCAEMETRSLENELIPLLYEEDKETVTYAINLIGDNEKAFGRYLEILTKALFDEDVRDAATEKLKENADAVKDEALSFYRKGEAAEYMLEILSRVKTRDEEVYSVLTDAFSKEEDKIPVHAGYLAAYGDERALPLLLEKIEDESIGFVEFQELKYAIEALGGEYDKPRDFSADKDFVYVGEASKKEIGEN